MVVDGGLVDLQVGEVEMIRQLIRRIEKSEVPLAEEEPQFEAIKEKYSRGQPLSFEEQDLVFKLAGKAGEWEKAVESSASTEPEQTLPGC
jgi:hypothetical protein